MSKGTVLVNLKRDWFGPDGSLYEVRDNPHEFPANFADAPEKVKKEKEDEPVNPRAQKYAVLPSTAEVVESSKTVVTVLETGGGQRVMVPTAVQDDVKSVGGAVGEHGIEEPDQSVAAAGKVAKDTGLDQVGGKPRESGSLPAGEKRKT